MEKRRKKTLLDR